MWIRPSSWPSEIVEAIVAPHVRDRREGVAAGPIPPGLVERMCARRCTAGPTRAASTSATGVALGVQRLRVIDLATGDQPIYNEDRSVAVILNGEIYNFRELRSELERRGHRFATRSDTEVIAHLYEE